MDGQPRILIIEDEKTLAELLKGLLEREGFDVEVTHDGDSGIRRISESVFDLVLLDLLLPGETGLTVMERIRKFDVESIAKTPIIIITNYPSPQYYEQCKQLGALDFLVKAEHPIMAIIRKVKRHIRKP